MWKALLACVPAACTKPPNGETTEQLQIDEGVLQAIGRAIPLVKTCLTNIESPGSPVILFTTSLPASRGDCTSTICPSSRVLPCTPACRIKAAEGKTPLSKMNGNFA